MENDDGSDSAPVESTRKRPYKRKKGAKYGFASMSAERRKQIAAMGGKARKAESRTFYDRDKAAEAGRKGGAAVPREKRSYSQNRALAVECGRKGGQSVPDSKRYFSLHPEAAIEAGRKGGKLHLPRRKGKSK